MRLTAIERKAQILATASKLFAEQGYEGTKTSQIAREAGVNEAIIFRHFINKEELYWAVLSDTCASNKWGERLRTILSQQAPMEEVVTELATELMQRKFEHPEWTRLLLFAALEHHKLSHRFFRSFVAGFYEDFASYIRQQMRRGTFRDDIDPMLSARAFFSMLMYHFQIQELFGGKEVHRYPLENVCHTFVGIWLQGMRTNAATAVGTKKVRQMPAARLQPVAAYAAD